MKKSLSIGVDAYWKLVELRAKLRAETWDDFVDKVYDLVEVAKAYGWVD